MATEITKEKLLNNLNELKDALELPNLCLENYFNDLRNDVDKVFAPKQLEFQNDLKKKKQLEELWQQIIAKIDSFEKNCTTISCDFESIKKRINEIEAIIETMNLEKAKNMIEAEEIKLMQDIFQNKSILFIKHSTHLKVESQLIGARLVILNDTYISKKSIEKR